MNKTVKAAGATLGALILGFGAAKAQERTIEGYVLGRDGNALPDMSLTLDTDGQEQTFSAADGYFRFNTPYNPTGILDIRDIGKLKFGPNPMHNQGQVWTKGTGYMMASSMNGKILDQANTKEDQDLDFTTNEKEFILSYINKDGERESAKILTTGNNIHIDINNHESPQNSSGWTKSGKIEQDTFSYKVRVEGTIDEQTIDTLINIIGFNKDQIYHRQDFTIPLNKALATINASNEQTDESLEDAMVIFDNLKGKIDTTYTDANGEVKKILEKGNLYVMKIAKDGYTGWVQEVKTDNDINIDKKLMQDELIEDETGNQYQLIEIFNHGFRNARRKTIKPDYNAKWTNNVKTTDDDNTTQLPQKYVDTLWEYIGKIETEIDNMPLSVEHKNKVKNFFTKMDTVYINQKPTDWRSQENQLYLSWSLRLPGTGDIGVTQDEDWNMINSEVRLRKNIVDSDYQMLRTSKQELYSFLFGAVDPMIMTSPTNSILDEGTNQTSATPLDNKLFEHAMNTPKGTEYANGVEVTIISNDARMSILIPENYEQYPENYEQ